MIRLLMFDPIAQLLLGSKYIAESGGKYPSRIGLHKEEGMVKSGFCFLNLSTQTDLRGEELRRRANTVSLCPSVRTGTKFLATPWEPLCLGWVNVAPSI